MPADSCAAQRFHSSSPRPAVKYPNPAMKLNQRTKVTTLPADALISGRPNNILPPSKTVMTPNATAKIPAAMAHFGRPDSLSVIVELRADRASAFLPDCVVRMKFGDQLALQRHDAVRAACAATRCRSWPA